MKHNKIFGNAMWIIAGKLGQAVLQLLITMLTARYFGPSNYGILNYAISLVTFFLPITKLGMDGILVHELLSKPEKEGEILGTVMISSLVSAVLCILGISGFVSLTSPGDTDTLVVTTLYSLVLLMEALQLLQYWFHAKLLSKYMSLAMLSAYVVMSAYQIYLLVTGKSIYWFALAKTLDVLVIDFLLVILYFRQGGQRFAYSLRTAKSLLERSKYYILSGMMVTVFAQSDRIMLKMMVGDAETGYYSAAFTCATMAGFVFTAIIDSMRPGILMSRQSDTAAFEKKMAQLYAVVIYPAVAFCAFVTLLSPLIIWVMYGSAYGGAVMPLRIVVWETIFAYLGAVRDIWILAEQKQRILWKINLLGALCNVGLNWLMIPYWGSNGAAVATLLTQIATNVLITFASKELRRSVYLMLQGVVLPREMLKKKAH